MTPRLRRGLAFSLLAAAGVTTALGFAYERPRPSGKPVPQEGQALGHPATSTAYPFGHKKQWNAEELLKRYPYESLARRLEYEAAAKKAPAPKLNDQSSKRLKALEEWVTASRRWGLRVRSLQMLHSKQVKEFISREGFGLKRMPDPSPGFLPLPDAPPIPFAVLGGSATEYEDEAPVQLPPTGRDRSATRLRLPSLEMVLGLHDHGLFNIFTPDGFGHVKDRDHVAGFRPHQARAMPELAHLELQQPARQGQKPEKPKDRWVITRLELMSLWKHKNPAVYVSDHLPRMQDLKKTTTRSLSDFEEEALAALKKGDDLATQATVNRIRMVGAVRAGKGCMDCHDVQRGQLLGAFCYELMRDPPLRAQK